MKAATSIIISILLTIIILKFQIPILKKFNFGQPIREEGNKEHYKKEGTPTMGGLSFVIVFIVLSFIINKINAELLFIILTTLAFGMIGFIDDYEKIVKKTNLGLTENQKLILQFIVSFILLTIFYFALDVNIGDIEIPLFKTILPLGIFSIPLLMIIMVGSVNAVNFTDGLDGLLSSVSIPVFIGIYLLSNNDVVSKTSLIFVGGLLGFLVFNSNPASIFMGDIGSMAIGGAIVSMLIVINKPIYYAVLGGIYLIEALSVVIQRIYFRKTGGKRIFLMSPIHHHYELKGFKETKIVTSFMVLSIILTLITIAIA